MFTNLYEHEKATNIAFDSVREYCITEKMPEDYLRGSIGKKKMGQLIIRSLKFIF